MLLLIVTLHHRARSPRLRSRSSSLSLAPSVSALSLDDEVLTVETLQTSRLDSIPIDIEEEPTYGPSVSIRTYKGHLLYSQMMFTV